MEEKLSNTQQLGQKLEQREKIECWDNMVPVKNGGKGTIKDAREAFETMPGRASERERERERGGI